jgi:hypothetical protein
MASRHHLPAAAAIAVVAALSFATPCNAGTAARTGETVNATAVATPAARQRPSRIAAWRDHRYDRYVRPIRSGAGCSSPWCGRQFVLMLGIGF